jgi:hypothetical protein
VLGGPRAGDGERDGLREGELWTMMKPKARVVRWVHAGGYRIQGREEKSQEDEVARDYDKMPRIQDKFQSALVGGRGEVERDWPIWLWSGRERSRTQDMGAIRAVTVLRLLRMVTV